MKKTLKTILILAMGVSLGLAIGYLKLRQERGLHERKIQDSQQKSELLHKRYTEQKALETQLMRGKALVEGQKRSVQVEMQKQEEEKKAILEEKGRLAEQSRGLRVRVSGLENELKEVREVHARLKAERENQERQHQKALADHKNELAKVNEERRNLEAELKGSLREKEQRLSRCISHNEKLSSTAGELLDRYDGKGVLGALLQKEPFTQIQRVEIENLIDEYRSRIEEGTLEKKGKAKR
ncbi:MAG: hypothetical protein AB1512_06765 [Thermodesulfobacteriota bacterium]